MNYNATFSDVQTKTIQADVPFDLFSEMEQLVKVGQFQNFNEMLLNALRQFVKVQENKPRLADFSPTVQFIVGQNGQPTAIVLDMAIWENIATWLEDVEDAAIISKRLKNWPTKEGWVAWEDFEMELMNDGLSSMD